MIQYSFENYRFWRRNTKYLCQFLNYNVKTIYTTKRTSNKEVSLWFYPQSNHRMWSLIYIYPIAPVKQQQAVEIEGDAFSLVTVVSDRLMRKKLEQSPTFHSACRLLVFNQQSYGTEPLLNTKHPLTHPQNQSSNNRAIETARGPAWSPRTAIAHWQSVSMPERGALGFTRTGGRADALILMPFKG